MLEATPEFKRRLREALDETFVGQTFTFRRTFTDGDVALFCRVTGDYNPYHQDAEFARESPYGRPTIPGLLTGSMLTRIGGLLGFLATEMRASSTWRWCTWVTPSPAPSPCSRRTSRAAASSAARTS